MYSDVFQCECTNKTLKTFLLEFMNIMGEIIPPKIARKYLGKPMGVITSSFDDISSRLLKCYTLEQMHDEFLSLTDNEQHFFISSIEIFELEFNSIEKSSIVCVPDDPKNYIKPYLQGLFTRESILV